MAGAEGFARLLTTCARHKLPAFRCLSRTPGQQDPRNHLHMLTTSPTPEGSPRADGERVTPRTSVVPHERAVPNRADRTKRGNEDRKAEVSCSRSGGHPPVGGWSPKDGAQSCPPVGDPPRLKMQRDVLLSASAQERHVVGVINFRTSAAADQLLNEGVARVRRQEHRCLRALTGPVVLIPPVLTSTGLPVRFYLTAELT